MKMRLRPDDTKVGDRIIYCDDEFVVVSVKACQSVKVGEEPFRLDEPYSFSTPEHARALLGKLYPYDFMMDRDGFVEVIRS